ncbi:MAG: hypothetical protein QOF29_2385 [bacterium]|jgi:hypothetical protein|nr:hypothetical protein [Solirubrobacteraceae bacterium]
MPVSRLALAFVIALRSVLVYGEATHGVAAEATWQDLLPARWRRAGARLARVPATAAPTSRARAVAGRSA